MAATLTEPLNLPDALPRADAAQGTLPIAMLGVAFDSMTTEQALDSIEGMVARRVPQYVVTANVDFLVQARRDAELRTILREADLTLCDGMPLVWASRWMGNALPERVAGADLVPRLLARAAVQHLRPYFLGGSPEANEKAVANLHTLYPGLDIAGHYSPPICPLEEMDSEDISRRIREAQPDLLFVSFGCPKAEKWIARNHRSLGVPVSMGVGATIDFLAGRMQRAPRWMQLAGTEWLFRLLQEPRRLGRRYASDLAGFGRAMMVQLMQEPVRFRRVPPLPAKILSDHSWQCLSLCGHVDASTLRRDFAACEKAASAGHDCLLDLSEVTFLDGTAVAFLLRLHRHIRQAGRKLVLFAPGRAVRRTLREAMLEDVMPIARSLAEAWPFLRGGPDLPSPR